MDTKDATVPAAPTNLTRHYQPGSRAVQALSRVGMWFSVKMIERMPRPCAGVLHVGFYLHRTIRSMPRPRAGVLHVGFYNALP